MKIKIETEVRRRANFYLPQTHLLVDYYRIRRKIAYPLPMRSPHLLTMPVALSTPYPWSIWLAWELEERIGSLGWIGQWQNDVAARQAAERDLSALAEWPCYRQFKQPDLSLGHTGRILWRAITQWNWLNNTLRNKIETALTRLVEDGVPYAEKQYGAFKNQADILQTATPWEVLQNIPFIGTIGIALAADTIKHPSATRLNQCITLLFSTMLDLRATGFTEGVAYDGYVLDFVMDWLTIINFKQRQQYLQHPHFKTFFEDSYKLAAPGNACQIAEIGDVEPNQMPFHLSAHAKTNQLQPDHIRTWHLQRCDLARLRVEALAAWHATSTPAAITPAAGAQAATSALILRSGWEQSDVAVAVANCNSPMDHIHYDNGSVVIGAAGQWLITDPGYQQYLAKQEREFTVGSRAHNAPVINGQAQAKKNSKQLSLTQHGSLGYAALDLTGCYADETIRSVVRHIWQTTNLVVIADHITAHQPLTSLAYHWHGHANAGWWIADNWAQLYLPEVTFWITSPQVMITESNVDRLSGSRGQLTLTASMNPATETVWWIFGVGKTKPTVKLEGRQLLVEGQPFDCPELRSEGMLR